MLECQPICIIILQFSCVNRPAEERQKWRGRVQQLLCGSLVSHRDVVLNIPHEYTDCDDQYQH